MAALEGLRVARVNAPLDRTLTVSEQEWLKVRRYLQDHRHRLGVAAAEAYPESQRVTAGPSLTTAGWLPTAPVPLDRITLELDVDAPFHGLTGSESVTEGVRPVRPDGSRYASYSAALSDLARPGIFEDRSTYRLIDADLEGDLPRLRFGIGTYFDSIDTGEAVGHEYAEDAMSDNGKSAFRDAIGSPVDPARRPTNLAITAVTIRPDRRNGDSRFLLQWRDPARVGHAAGLYQVLPVGVFQPATEADASLTDDLSLWRCLVREYAEELLGEEESAPDAPPIDYDSWPLAVRMSDQLQRGVIRPYGLGMSVDPLTLATDLLVAVVIDTEAFNELFDQAVDSNAEGRLVGSGHGVPFVESEIERLVRREPMQAAGAAALALAWEHRQTLLS